jgi:fibronectin-binding autotransporter adhesin
MKQARGSGRFAHRHAIRLGLALALVVAALAAQAAPPARAATIDVTTPNDVLDANGGVCAGLTRDTLPGPDGKVSLREALCAANSSPDADTITLPSGEYHLSRPGSGEDGNSTGDLDILAAGGDLTINGAGAADSRIIGPSIILPPDRVLHINPGCSDPGIIVTLSGLTIQDGWSTNGIGGGISICGNNTVSLTQCRVTGNVVTTSWFGAGGGIHVVYGGTLNLSATAISDNQVTCSAGGVVVGGGLYTGPESTVNITDNSLIIGNLVQSVPGSGHEVTGGGLYNLGGVVNLDHSSVKQNRATGGAAGSVGSGGGIFNAMAGTVNLTNAAWVLGNDADLQGGGIYNTDLGSEVHITDSTLNANKVTGGSDGVECEGGGIYNTSHAEVTIGDSELNKNQAGSDGPPHTGRGGGIFNLTATLTISRTTLSQNIGHFACGAISNNAASTVTLTDCTLSKNLGFGRGGAICTEDSTLVLSACTLSGNQSEGFGGGIVHFDGTTSLSNCTLSGNWAESMGGGLYQDDGHVYISGSTLEGNSVGTGLAGNGGGIYKSAGTLYLTNSTLSGNGAGLNGGGLYQNGESTQLAHVTITRNVADASGAGQGDGGGIFNASNALVKLRNTILAGNSDSGDEAPDCSGTLETSGNNLVQSTDGCTLVGGGSNETGTDPGLDPLNDNGGRTETHALQSGSPALDAVATCTDTDGDPVTIDQRGVPRPQGPRCDIGAYERGWARVFLPVVLR